ncbi:MAG TPA: WG repeat-containing protein [Phycisphaerae bacterium]|nr:WG repeat-containing protein [Phycisphaerae bacterium]
MTFGKNVAVSAVLIGLILVCSSSLHGDDKPPTGDQVLYPISQFDPKLREYACGYIGPMGLGAIATQFCSGTEFSEGMAAVQTFEGDRDLYGFIDLTGKVVIKPQFTRFKPFSQGLAVVCRKTEKLRRSWAVIDKRGKVIFAGQKHEINSFSDGLALVRTVGYIDTSGKVVLKLEDIKADWVGPFSQGLARAKVDGKYGYVDKTGKMVIKPAYERAKEFKQKLAAVRIDGKYGYIDPKGKVVIPAKYDRADNFSEGLASVKSGKYYGYIDAGGKEVIECQYLRALEFSEGLGACELLTEKWVYIDRTGKTIITGDDEWVYADPFRGGAAKIGASRWVNKKGRVIWKPGQQ